HVDAKLPVLGTTPKVPGADRIAVLAALNITHDLLHKEHLPDVQTSGSTREQVRELLDKGDLVLATDTPGTPASRRG
ncbi:cell division protein ZapA, partial [Pseudomonas syringae group genomosp. 7]|uniref:cell division protein ZapA n=1 Tax=Pseudomonas syringae group genomosp. 7 TaxID=251699 RepID=UPI00376F561B